jgi:hypothetical protein
MGKVSTSTALEGVRQIQEVKDSSEILSSLNASPAYSDCEGVAV